MEKVLIALDYNPCAQKVAEAGHELAKKIRAETLLVHVIRDRNYYHLGYSTVMGFNGFNNDETFKSAAEQKKEAKAFLKAAAKHLGHEGIQIKVLEGQTAEAILDAARQWSANLIVAGAQSHNSVEKEVLGSVSSAIVQSSPVPVVIVPTEKPDFNKNAVTENVAATI